MSLLDRHILIRFGANFAVLFTLLFVFAVAIDVILTLDRFVDAAGDRVGDEGGLIWFAGTLVGLVVDFEAPRLFQFYAFLHALIAIGAMGFTLAQMHRHRELVAIMASGVSLTRVAMPFILATFVLSMVQLLNQELILPRVAPMLLRSSRDIGDTGIERFEVRFTPDANGHLFTSPSYDPRTRTLHWPTILERDDKGRTIRRIWAERATWSDDHQHWRLDEGRALRPRPRSESELPDQPVAAVSEPEVIESYRTDLTPQALLVRRYNQFAGMLSLRQIDQMLQTLRTADRDTLLRHYYGRFSSVLVNLLVLALALPCFLLREPANLLRQSVLCAGLTIPATIGAAIGMMVELPGVPPAAAVFMPVIVLGLLCFFPWSFFKT
jgi:lipopolysaccharide export LptBFGC system permease protein LptF